MISLQKLREGIPSEGSVVTGQTGADGGTATHAGRWGPSRNAKRAGLADLEQHAESMHLKPSLAAAPLKSLRVGSSGRANCNHGSGADKPSARRSDFRSNVGQTGADRGRGVEHEADRHVGVDCTGAESHIAQSTEWLQSERRSDYRTSTGQTRARSMSRGADREAGDSVPMGSDAADAAYAFVAKVRQEAARNQHRALHMTHARTAHTKEAGCQHDRRDRIPLTTGQCCQHLPDDCAGQSRHHRRLIIGVCVVRRRQHKTRQSSSQCGRRRRREQVTRTLRSRRHPPGIGRG